MDIMTLKEVSADIRVPEPTLRYWRHKNEGPKSFRVGRRVMYLREDVQKWLQEQYDADTDPAA